MAAWTPPRGTCEGRIAHGRRGEHGFGFDPVFYLPEYGRTMAEIPPPVKNRISHRARAAAGVRNAIARRSGAREAPRSSWGAWPGEPPTATREYPPPAVQVAQDALQLRAVHVLDLEHDLPIGGIVPPEGPSVTKFPPLAHHLRRQLSQEALLLRHLDGHPQPPCARAQQFDEGAKRGSLSVIMPTSWSPRMTGRPPI